MRISQDVIDKEEGKSFDLLSVRRQKKDRWGEPSRMMLLPEDGCSRGEPESSGRIVTTSKGAGEGEGTVNQEKERGRGAPRSRIAVFVLLRRGGGGADFEGSTRKDPATAAADPVAARVLADPWSDARARGRRHREGPGLARHPGGDLSGRVGRLLGQVGVHDQGTRTMERASVSTLASRPPSGEAAPWDWAPSSQGAMKLPRRVLATLARGTGPSPYMDDTLLDAPADVPVELRRGRWYEPAESEQTNKGHLQFRTFPAAPVPPFVGSRPPSRGRKIE